MAEENTAERQPWDRQPGESSWDFARFRRYRDQGPARSIPNAVRAWLADERPVRVQQRRYRERLASGGDLEDYVLRVTRTWWGVCRKWGWVERVHAFDEMVEAEARQQAIVDHVEAEAEQMRLRIVAARTLRSRGLAIWDRFGALVDEGRLEEMTLERLKHVVTIEGSPATGTTEEKPASRAEREVPSIFSQLGLAREAIAEGLKQERLELGEVTDRTAVEGVDSLAGMSDDQLRRGRDRLEELLGDSDPDSQ